MSHLRSRSYIQIEPRVYANHNSMIFFLIRHVRLQPYIYLQVIFGCKDKYPAVIFSHTAEKYLLSEYI
jgi:hypothetical protein